MTLNITKIVKDGEGGGGGGEIEETFISTGMDDLLEGDQRWKENCANISSSSGEAANSTCNLTGNGESSAPIEIPMDYTKIGVLTSIIVLTVIGNVAVIMAIGARRAKMTRMYYFILHLSLADLLTAFLTLLPELAWTFTYPDFHGGVVMCKFVKFVQMLGPYLSSYVLIMTAVDRYQAICNPLGNCTWTPKRSKIMIGVAWVVSILLCVPQAFIFQGASCRAHFAPGWGMPTYVTWFSISNFFIPLVVLLFCYSRICFVIWDNVKSKQTTSSASEDNRSLLAKATYCARRCLSCRGFHNKGGADRPIKYRWRSSLQKSNGTTSASVAGVGDTADNSLNMASSASAMATSNEGHHHREHDPNAIHLNNAAAANARQDDDGDCSSDDSSIESADRRIFQFQKRGGHGSDEIINLEVVDNGTTTITVEPPSTPSGGDQMTPDQARSLRAKSKTPSFQESDMRNNSTDGGRRMQPRSHSIKGVSRAKIKTIKLTVTVIAGYILCSAPFICVQLWAVYGSPSETVLSSMNFLFWLLTLNSVVNPWIYMVFNANLVESLSKICFCGYSFGGKGHRNKHKSRRGHKGGGGQKCCGLLKVKNGDDEDQRSDRTSRSVSPANRSRSVTITTTVTHTSYGASTTMLRT